MDVFTPEFLSVGEETIIEEIKKTGFYSFDKALTDEFIEVILTSVEKNRFGINKNSITGVMAGKQYYFNQMLAICKEFYEYICHAKVLKLCRQTLGKSFRVVAMRYYETKGGFHMQWHTDNKTDREFYDVPGLIFIVYCMDVTEGEFQYVSGSHEWSGQKAYSDYSDEEIERNYKDRIVSFKKPKGSIVIYNTYGIHRAKPVSNPGYVRKSLFFQADATLNNAEPILLNSSFCHDLTEEKQNFLGFGLPSNYKMYPTTDLKDHPLTLELFKQLGSWIAYRTSRRLYDMLPNFIRDKIRKKVKKSV